MFSYLEKKPMVEELRLEDQAGNRVVSKEEFCREKGIGSIIRFHTSEFDCLPEEGIFTHFNLGTVEHSIGKRYGLMRIVDTGFALDGRKIADGPSLTAEDMLFAQCIEVVKGCALHAVHGMYFRDSFEHIHDADSLKGVLLARYAVSRPELLREEILKQGVTITRLKITSARRPSRNHLDCS
jgi:hypothetical protein